MNRRLDWLRCRDISRTRTAFAVAFLPLFKQQEQMSWVSETISALKAGEAAQVRPQGGSMRGRIESGQLVTIVPVTPDSIKIDDVVFIRWKGNYILHVVKDVGDEGFLIGNNIGKINGWANRNDVLGVVTAVAE